MPSSSASQPSARVRDHRQRCRAPLSYLQWRIHNTFYLHHTSCSTGRRPIIDYDPRDEITIQAALKHRSHDQKLKALSSASLQGVGLYWPEAEQTNSTAKDDFSILLKPRVRDIHYAGILSQIAVMAMLQKNRSLHHQGVTIPIRKKLLSKKLPRDLCITSTFIQSDEFPHRKTS